MLGDSNRDEKATRGPRLSLESYYKTAASAAIYFCVDSASTGASVPKPESLAMTLTPKSLESESRTGESDLDNVKKPQHGKGGRFMSLSGLDSFVADSSESIVSQVYRPCL